MPSATHSHRTTALCLLAALACAVPAGAQYHVDSWTTSEGLPQNSVQSILQTRDGYLWLTTFDGLVRFDGMRFTVFTRAGTPGIQSNRFTALYEDHAGTEPTLACPDASGRLLITRMREPEPIVLGPPPPALTANLSGAVIYEDRERNIWIGSGAGGLHRLRRQLIRTISIAEGLRDRTIYPVCQDRAGAIWLGAWMRTLARITGEGVENYGAEIGLTGDPISALHGADSGGLESDAARLRAPVRPDPPGRGRRVLPRTARAVLALAV
jgi:ligand-binding sensor domain-containing protein